MISPAQKIEKATSVFLSIGAQEFYIFGSASTNSMHEGSDIDFAVRGTPPEYDFTPIGKVLSEVGDRIDVVNLDIRTPFTRHLESRGKLVRVG